MPKIEYSRQFKKDLQRVSASGWPMEPFERFIHDLMTHWPLPRQYEAHAMRGDMKGIWDIHIRQNWLVFVKAEGDTITLLRTGTHAMLGM